MRWPWRPRSAVSTPGARPSGWAPCSGSSGPSCPVPGSPPISASSAWSPPAATKAIPGSSGRALAAHLRFAVASLAAARLRYVQLALTPLSEAGEQIAAAVTSDLSGDRSPGTAAVIVLDHTRATGRGYYRDLCFKVNARTDGQPPGTLHEIGDGGFTSRTQQLVASHKERLLISGIGVDRLAACGPP